MHDSYAQTQRRGLVQIVRDAHARWQRHRFEVALEKAIDLLDLHEDHLGMKLVCLSDPTETEVAYDDAPMPQVFRTATDARKLIEPTDLEAIPPLDFVAGAPFHIARGTVTTLFGLGGVGKSSFAVALGAHLALGKDFLGATVTKCRVFYGEFEGAGQLLARTTRKVFAALEADLPGAAEVLDRDFKQKHFTPKEKAAWGYAAGMVPELINQLGTAYDVLIFDSYEAATMSDPNDPQSAAQLMMLFARLAVETNTAVILVDHAPKHNRGSVFGSTKKTDFARVVINLEAVDGGGGRQLRLNSTKCNVAPKPYFPVVDRRETESSLRFCPVTSFTLGLSGASGTTAHRTEQLVREALDTGASTRTAVYEHIQAKEGLDSTDTARKRVTRAGLEHLLPRPRNGRHER